jgi:NADPH:quinone reductase-like Zn-dependent oxidoreductase
MKAVVYTKHGGLDVLQLAEVPVPQIGSGEVLVRVRACALNHLDLWVRKGITGVEIPMPHIPGSDISGEIAKIGDGITHLRVGERVLLAPGLSCGTCAQCAAGNDNLCRHYTLFGYKVDGGYAEYVKSPAINAIPIPGHMTFEEAAAFPLVFLTAWHMLITRAGLKPGEDVLVLGAGSGVGSAAIQIAKVVGARVIATAGSEVKLAKAKELGADEAILHGPREWSRDVRQLTNRRGVDVVFEHVGEKTWDESLKSLAPAGRLVTCGATTGFEGKIDIRLLFSRNLSILGSYMGSRAELFDAVKLAGRHLLKPVIDKVFLLAQAVEAQRRLENRQQFGKIVLRVD